jgi:hypothetical protein
MKHASSSAQNLVLLALTLALLLALSLPVSSQQHGGGRSRTTEAIPAPRMGLGADPGNPPTPCPRNKCTPCPATGRQPVGGLCETPCPITNCTPCPVTGRQPIGGVCATPCPVGICTPCPGTHTQPIDGQCPTPCPTPTCTPCPACGQPAAGSCPTCCDCAKANGLDQGHGGGVVCCDGGMHSCDWAYPTGPGGPKLHDCIMAHEDQHQTAGDVQPCPTPPAPTPTRPPFPPGTDTRCAECHAYMVEIQCLETRIASCNDEASQADRDACVAAIQNRINQLRGATEGPSGLCSSCSNPTPTPVPTHPPIPTWTPH